MTETICRKCLISEMDERGLYAIILDMIAALPEDDRAHADVYQSRIALCKSCDALNSGTCVKCGCYVELRASKLRMGCPHTSPKWLPVTTLEGRNDL